MKSICIAVLLTFATCWAQETKPAETAAPAAAETQKAPDQSAPAAAPAQPEKPAAAAAKAPAVSDKAIIHVYRYKQFVGSGLEPSIYCDEIQLARMDNGRFFTVQVPAGHHVFRANDKQSGIEADFKAGQTYYIRTEIVAGFMKGHGRLILIAPEQGSFEVKKLQPLGADKIKNTELVKMGL